jgi:hypothetical protein
MMPGTIGACLASSPVILSLSKDDGGLLEIGTLMMQARHKAMRVMPMKGNK